MAPMRPRAAPDNPFDPSLGKYARNKGMADATGNATSTCAISCSPGAAKGLSLQVSHVSHRANAAQGGDDIDRLYVVIQYPLNFGPF